MEKKLREAVGLPERPAENPSPPDSTLVPPRSVRRRPPPAALGALIVGAIAGALFGAAMRPLKQDRFLAEAVVGVESSDASDQAKIWRTFADTLELPQVGRSAARAGNLGIDPSEIAGRVEAVGDPRTKILRVRARADSDALAAALADAVTTQAIEFSRRAARENLVDPTVHSTFDFEDGLDGFTSRTLFTTPAEGLRQTSGGVTPGSRTLAFRCALPQQGCGPGTRIRATFNPGTQYMARARAVSSRGSAPVRLVLGSSSTDVAVGDSTVVKRDRFTPLRVTWTPSRPATSAVVALQTTSAKRVDLRLDNVEVFDPAQAQVDPGTETRANRIASVLRARRAANADAYVRVAAATPSGTVGSSTAGWVALGGGLGVVMALAGLLLARQARRRQE